MSETEQAERQAPVDHLAEIARSIAALAQGQATLRNDLNALQVGSIPKGGRGANTRGENPDPPRWQVGKETHEKYGEMMVLFDAAHPWKGKMQFGRGKAAGIVQCIAQIQAFANGA